jgi:signal transduction histidine kinase
VVFLPVAVVAGLPRGAVLVVRDRTREHVAEKKLALAAHASQAAEQAGAEALSRAAHQLRTPLAGMMLWTKLLEEQPAANAAQRREALQAIRSCVEEQMAIIDALSGRTGTAEQTRK